MDPAIFSCWWEQVKQRRDCSLLLECTEGKVTTSLKSSLSVLRPKLPNMLPLWSLKKAILKKGEGKGFKLMTYHQQSTVIEKGRLQTRLMTEKALLSSASPFTAKPTERQKRFTILAYSITNQSIYKLFILCSKYTIGPSIGTNNICGLLTLSPLQVLSWAEANRPIVQETHETNYWLRTWKVHKK